MSSWNKYICCIPRRTMIGFSCGQLQSIVGSSTQEAISMDWIGGWIHLLAQICRGSQKIVSKSKSFVSCFSFKHIYIYTYTYWSPVRFIGHIWKHQRSVAWWNLPNRCPRRNGEAITFKVTFSEQPKLMVQFLRSYSNIGDETCSDGIGKILRNMWAQKNPRVRVKFSAHKAR